jgi:hypothetical protein
MSMNRNESIRITEEVLDSLDGIRSASPAPFLYTRIRNRMENRVRPVWERLSEGLARPWVAATLAFFLLAVNAYIVLNAKESRSVQPPDEHLFASHSEYATHTSSFYDSNPEWP